MSGPGRVDRVVLATEAMFNDATYGLNAQLANVRAEYSPALTTGQLPDVQQVDTYLHRTGEGVSLKYPYVSIIPVQLPTELEPNSRFYDVRMQVTVVVLEQLINGPGPDVARAAWLMWDGLLRLHNLRRNADNPSPSTPTGKTLFNGGSTCTGRVIHSSLGDARLVQDRRVGLANYAIRGQLTARVAGNY